MVSKIPCPISLVPQPSKDSKDPRGAFTWPRGGTRGAVEARTLSSLYLSVRWPQLFGPAFTSASCLLLAMDKLDNTLTQGMDRLGFLQPFPPYNSLQTYYLLYFTTSLQKIPPPITPLQPFPSYLFPLYTITH